MSTHPTPALTFLFSGVAPGSPESRHQQDSLLREIVSKHHGLVFKVLQTGYCIVFPGADAGIHAALETQRALAALSGSAAASNGRVCMALYTGQAQSRDNDYFGPPLNRAARFLAAGHCGQILVSEPTANEVRHALPAGARLRDLGMHRLKDLPPERIYQLTHPDLPEHFAPLRSLESFTHNLPRHLTGFVGRDGERSELKRLLSISRLVTLTGMSGVGKTRLALQTAEELAEEFPDGVWCVDLETLEPAADVPGSVARSAAVATKDLDGVKLCAAIASAIGANVIGADGTDLPSLVEALRHRNLLLVLDTCEIALTLCAEVAEDLSAACGEIRILAVGDEPLGLPGEAVFRLPGLTCAPCDSGATAASLLQTDSARLFLERALLSNPSFAITERNAAAVAALCRELDGLPLALELAAARAKVLSVEQIVARLPDRFRLLTSPGRSALPRHQSLRASLDWCCRRLSVAERALLKALAARPEPWTEADLAERRVAVSSSEAAGGVDGKDRGVSHASLVDKGLVVPDREGPGETRFRLGRSVRLYAKEFSGYF